MDDPIFLLIVPLVGGAFCWQMSALHIEQYLAANDPEHQPPGFLAKFFLGRLFTTMPLLGRYSEVREANALPPLGTYGFWGGLGVTLLGLLALLGTLASL
jgi:hypothetical protein